MENENITRLFIDGKEIILVATAHVSKESAELVRATIEAERPDSVCIELDAERYENIKNPKTWADTDITQVIKKGRVGFLLANLILGAYQKRMAKKLDTAVGSEMFEGMKCAEEIGAELVLADRKIQTTFMRIWRKMGIWEKAKMLAGIIVDDEDEDITSDDIEDMLKTDMLSSAVAAVHEQLPGVGEILIKERDAYLAHNIAGAPGPKVVAVLGGAHVEGVSAIISSSEPVDMDEISAVPPKSPLSKIIGFLIPMSFIAMLAFTFSRGFDTGIGRLKSWALTTGTSAAIFTALTLPHPLSILTAFVTAPFTTLNPMLACGWFVGLTEAALRKPTVKDIENIQDDIFSLKGFIGNRFLKTLLIVIVANIGSSLGSFMAGTNLIRSIIK